MPTRADVNFLLTAVKAKFINADQAKQIYEAHQAAEKRGEDPLIYQTAQKLSLLDMAQSAKLQRMLLSVGDENEGKDKKSKKKVTQIGDFKLQSKLGEGAMGVVYKATQLATGREVAIKVLLRKFQEDEKYLARFKRECGNAKRLDHPNIIEFVDAGQATREQGGYYYFAMEFVDGETLQEILDEKGLLPEEQVAQVGIEIGKALAHAHNKNIKHRDIKPDNIMIARSGEIKLTDLGLAKEELDSSVTQAGMTIGTPHYMSPEQARGMELDDRSDLYSLGATLYHLLTGQPPFEGKSAAVVMMKHIEEQLPSPQEMNPEISDEICVIIGKMMMKDPDDRYPNCSELVADLERAKAGQSVEAPSTQSSIRMPAAKKKRPAGPRTPPQPEKPAPAPPAPPGPAGRTPADEAPASEPPATRPPAGPAPVVVAAMTGTIVLLLAIIAFLLWRKFG